LLLMKMLLVKIKQHLYDLGVGGMKVTLNATSLSQFIRHFNVLGHKGVDQVAFEQHNCLSKLLRL
jgi:hypothetical protein